MIEFLKIIFFRSKTMTKRRIIFSYKKIIKFGLIAEIITAIIGLIGEFTFRYHIYSQAMNDLFGPYYYQPEINQSQTDKFFLAKIYAQKHHHIEWPSNHQHYDHQTGESFQLSQLNAIADFYKQNPINSTTNQIGKISNNSREKNFFTKFLTKLSSWIFPHETSSLFYGNKINPKDDGSDTNDDNDDTILYDFRPLYLLNVLILINLIFIAVVVLEYLPFIGFIAILWIFYLIMLFVIARVMKDSIRMIENSTDEILSSTSRIHSWTSMLPSRFIILIAIIIILLTFALIALITEERRQLADRMRSTRSACIPLVKSRDMDLDDV